MATMQTWQVSTGDTSAEVRADNWLGALAAALPRVGVELGVLGRLVCALDVDGNAVAKDPKSNLEIRVSPVGGAAEAEDPEGDDAARGAARLYAPQMKRRVPLDSLPPLENDPNTTDEVPLSQVVDVPEPKAFVGRGPEPTATFVPPAALAESRRGSGDVPVGGSSGVPAAPAGEAVAEEEVEVLTDDIVAAPEPVIAAPVELPPAPAEPASAPPMPATLLGPPTFSLTDRLEDLFMRLGEINEAPTLNKACGAALRIASELIPADAGAVLIKTRAGDGLRFRAAMGPAAAEVIDSVIPLDRGIAGFTFQMGLAISIEDVKADSRHYGRVDRATGYATKAVLAAPVRADEGGIFGCIELINPPRPFTDDDLEVATRVAATLGAYLHAGIVGN